MSITKKTSYQFFRIRQHKTVVGYLRYLSSTSSFYSTDKLWWVGTAIPYSFKDSYVEYNDKNKQWLFEWDIIEMHSREHTDTSFLAVIVFDPDTSTYVAVSCETFDEIHIIEWARYRICWKHYLFLNDDLLEEFKDGQYVTTPIF